MSARIGPAVVAELRARCAAGEAITAVARDLGVSVSRAWQIAKDTRPALRLRGAAHPLVRRPELAARGERQGLARLTEQSVRDIRQRYSGGETVAALAAAHQVSGGCIRHVLARETWRHVE